MKVEMVDNKMLMIESTTINLFTTVFSGFQRVSSTLMLSSRVIINTGTVKYIKLSLKFQLIISVFSISSTASILPPALNSPECSIFCDCSISALETH